MRVLFLTHRLPYAPNRGDRIRAYYTLQVLRPVAEVDLISLVHDREEALQVATMRGLAASVSVAPVGKAMGWLRGALAFPSSVPLTHVLLDSATLGPAVDAVMRAHPPDVVLAYCSGMARIALMPPLAGLPLVIDMVDVDSLKWQAMARKSGFPMRAVYAREARCLARFEAEAVLASFATMVVNERERDALAHLGSGTRVHVVPSGVDVEHFRPTGRPRESHDVVFCGVMNYQPNEDAAIWFATDVWRLVLRRVPQARLRLVGAEPSRALLALARRDRSIEVTGSVPDVRPFLWDAAVAVAPLRIARGIQNKVLEAVAAGLPTIVTRVVADGLPAEVLPACEVTDTPEDMAEALALLLGLPAANRRARAETANLAALSWPARLAPLTQLLVAAAASPAH